MHSLTLVFTMFLTAVVAVRVPAWYAIRPAGKLTVSDLLYLNY